MTIRNRESELHDRAGGYTLVEILVALVMFTFISLATSAAITTAMRNLHTVQQRADDTQEARAILQVVTKDLRSAYASADNPYTFFMAQGDGSSTTSANFTTRAVQIVPDVSQDSATPTLSNPVPQSGAVMAPQSDVSMVTYVFDPNSHSLYRTVANVPDPDLMSQQPSPQSLISNRVLTLQLEFQDPANPDPQNGWIPMWSFAANPSALGVSNTTTQANTTLPMAVRVNVALMSDGPVPVTYSTTVAIATPQPQAKGQAPPTTTTTTTPTGGGSNGNNNGNNNKPGGNNTGGGTKPGGSTPSVPTAPAGGAKM